MNVREALIRLGGVARSGELVRITSRHRVAAAVASGEIIRAGRGYALPEADSHLVAAQKLGGVLSHGSAALQLGWAVKQPPRRPAVIVPNGRRVATDHRHQADVRYRDLVPDQIRGGGYTDPLTTLVDCAKTLPFDEALAIADSALRTETVTPEQLIAAMEAVPTRGRAACLRVARHADGRAMNPFESVMRAHVVDLLDVVPQARVALAEFDCHPDLVDAERRIVLEADSWEFHGGRREFARDCERYNALVLAGWTVLRFSYEAVMGRATYVRDCVLRARAGSDLRHVK